MNRLPLFFNYKQEGKDHGYEAMQDFFLGWTLRCAESKHQIEHTAVNSYAKRVAYALLFGVNKNNELNVDFGKIDEFEVLDVKTKRQFKWVDLLVEIEVKIPNGTEKYLLNIENKWYTTIRENQLSRYKAKLQNSEYKDWNIINWVIFCDNEILGKPSYNQIEKCVQDGYNYTHIDELINLAMPTREVTGNYLFDEYWFKFHG